MMRSRIAAVACLVLGLAIAPASEAGYSQMVVFGDSLSDTGNVYLATMGTTPPTPPYSNGEYSNGPISIQYLAQGLGLPAPTPSLAGGNDYAFGGAQTGAGTSVLGTPNIDEQIQMFLATRPTITPGELFTVWGGANDFLNAHQTDYTVPVTNLANEIMALAGAGAKEFLVPNLPALGMLPATSGLPSPLPIQLNQLTAAYNADLAATLAQLQKSLGVTIHQVDINAIFQQAINNPRSFGLTNVTDPAFDGTTVAANNGAGYLFWDTVHPTTQVQQIVGNAMVQAVPEPSSFALLAIAGSCLAARVVRSRRREG